MNPSRRAYRIPDHLRAHSHLEFSHTVVLPGGRTPGGVSSAGSRDRLTRLEKTSGIAESAAYSRSILGEDRSNRDVRRGMVEEGSVAVKLLGHPRGRQ